METITYRIKNNGIVQVCTVPWSLHSQQGATQAAVDGIVQFSMGSPPTQPQSILDLLKKQLADTDYQVLKYTEGFLPADEYATIREQRAQWRTEYNTIEEELYSAGIGKISR